MPWQNQQHRERTNIGASLTDMYEAIRKDKTYYKGVEWDGEEWSDDDADCKFD